MRRIAILMMTIVAVVSSGCGWKANLDWCEKPNGQPQGEMHRQADRRVAELPAGKHGDETRDDARREH